MRIHSITIVGNDDQLVRIERTMVPVGLRVEVTLPYFEVVDSKAIHKADSAGILENDREAIYHKVVPLVYGRSKNRHGSFDCTNSEANDVIDEVQRLFW